MQTYNEEFHIKPILDVIREGKLRWLGHVMRREPPSMLHEVVNYKVKGTRPRGRPRTTWLKSMDNQLKEKGSSMKDVMFQNLYQRGRKGGREGGRERGREREREREGGR